MNKFPPDSLKHNNSLPAGKNFSLHLFCIYLSEHILKRFSIDTGAILIYEI